MNPTATILASDNPLSHVVQHDLHWGLPFTVTNHMLMVILAAILMLIILPVIARQRSMVPRGLRNFFESICVFIREEVARPVLGHNTDRFMPYPGQYGLYFVRGKITALWGNGDRQYLDHGDFGGICLYHDPFFRYSGEGILAIYKKLYTPCSLAFDTSHVLFGAHRRRGEAFCVGDSIICQHDGGPYGDRGSDGSGGGFGKPGGGGGYSYRVRGG